MKYRVTLEGKFRAYVVVEARDEEHAKTLAPIEAGRLKVGTLPMAMVENIKVFSYKHETSEVS